MRNSRDIVRIDIGHDDKKLIGVMERNLKTVHGINVVNHIVSNARKIS